MSKGKIILVDGHNYTGKTTLVKLLCDEYDAISISSPQGYSDFTENNYNSLKKNRHLSNDVHALIMLANHYEIINEANRLKDDGCVCILDRSLLSLFVYQNFDMYSFKRLLYYAKIPKLNVDHSVILLCNEKTIKNRMDNRSDNRVLDNYFIDNIQDIIMRYRHFYKDIYPQALMIETDVFTPDQVLTNVMEVINEFE